MTRRCRLLMAVLGVLTAAAGLVHASATPAQKCAVAKSKAAVKKLGAKAKCWQKAVLAGAPNAEPTCLASADTKFGAAIAKAEAKGGCAVTGDGDAIEGASDTCVGNIVALTPGTTTTTVCRPNGDFCSGNLECCSASCTNGQCTSTPCVDDFGSCTVGAECCGGYCISGQCMTARPYPAPHPALPQVVNAGGPVIAAPVVYPVMFANEDPNRAASLADFLAQFSASSEWTAMTAEYGIGPLTVMAAITQSAISGVVDDSAIQSLLAGSLNADNAAFPTADANTLFVVFPPAGVAITLNGGTSCNDFGGYHSQTALDGTHSGLVVPYVVVPNCNDPGGFIGGTTAAASHELVEAVTDPQYFTAPAYQQVDVDHLAWSFGLGGGEVCDLCAQDAASFVQLGSSAYVVQRCWSNAAAAASHDPCVPAPTNQAYFNAAPDLPDTITVGGKPTKGLTIPTGTSRTIPVTLFSDAATSGPITVTAIDPFNSSGLLFAFDNALGVNGMPLNLTITATKSIHLGAALFVVRATVGTTSHNWYGEVGQ